MRLRIFPQKGKEKQSREQELKNILSIKFQINSKDQVPLKVLQRKKKRTKRQKLSSNKISQS